MIITGDRTKQLCTPVVDNIYTNYHRLESYISSRLDYYISGQKELESEPVSLEEKERLRALNFDVSEGILCTNRSVNRSSTTKIMNVWNRFMGLSYLSGKLDTLAQDRNVRLCTYISKVFFKENASMISKIIQIASSLFGITHVSLIITLFLSKLFPSSLRKIKFLIFCNLFKGYKSIRVYWMSGANA